jgi:sialic acid synthase SpsE
MSNLVEEFEINGKKIGKRHSTYFIADIAANHDGDLKRAIELINLAAESGADAAKFQHFQAATIVSDYGFKSIKTQNSHQSNWEKSVFEVYKSATVNLDWTESLREACNNAGIAFFTSPYSIELVNYIDAFVPAYKIGSGDITWIELVELVASKQKPYILASGASTMDDVTRAVMAALKINKKLCLMQCNTNYTASLENFKYIQLNVLKVYREMFPELVLGLSDHTQGFSTVLGAVSLGARMIEKHFTDDVRRKGPDHVFAMDPNSWREMVKATRELEAALGNGIKQVEKNEIETYIVQRRAICARNAIKKGTIIKGELVSVLRPCPADGIPPYRLAEVEGKKITRDYSEGEYIRWIDLE